MENKNIIRESAINFSDPKDAKAYKAKEGTRMFIEQYKDYRLTKRITQEIISSRNVIEVQEINYPIAKYVHKNTDKKAC